MRTGRVPTRPLHSLVSMRSDSYTIYEDSGGNTDGWNDDSQIVSTGVSVPLDVYGHSTARTQYPTGEVRETTLQGVCLPSEKVPELTNGNYIVHGGEVFEVQLDAWPNDTSPDLYMLDLSERTDLDPP